MSAESPASGERELTLCTAGHIDHGKSALVEALTGKGTDRLAEERRRGISIELGFAELGLRSGRRLSVVDVPGHEALVRTMVAGAGGVDLTLLVVAADDGPMPQTYEHLDVLRALEVEVGVVALTKVDVVDRARRDSVAAAISARVPGAPVVGVSAVTGEGLEELDAALETAAAELATRPDGQAPPATALHVDRVFTLPGPGTVATGTLGGGPLARGADLRALPRGLELRIRSLQIHDRDVDPAPPGRRVAVALTGAHREELERGDVLVPAGSPLRSSYRLDVELAPGLDLATLGGERLQVHHGTRESPARLVAIGSRFAQLRLESELVARPRDRVVLRRIAPAGTLGGATVLDPAPPRHGTTALDRLEAVATGEPERLVREELAAHGRLALDPGDWSSDSVPGLARPRFADERWRRAVEVVAAEEGVTRNGDAISRTSATAPAPPPPAELGQLERILLTLIERGGDSPPSTARIAAALGRPEAEVNRALDQLVGAGELVRLARDLHVRPDVLAGLERTALEVGRENGGEITIAALRDRIGSSRKYTQALLEHLDSEQVTIRRGDRHLIRSGRR
ncbi:selenocysteine-specific translation elongation factor [Thermoleophilia bacterium SCSIO 60948]|nr:selenocysteine-specific translation elongation factor [Thermoleophilia bacterium SCSIO 60948]